jgi:hypothetical protein
MAAAPASLRGARKLDRTPVPAWRRVAQSLGGLVTSIIA